MIRLAASARAGMTTKQTMSTLICFGLGYSAEHFIGMFGDGFERIVGTVRGAERAAILNARFGGRLKAFAFDGTFATPEVVSAIGEADVALVSIPQTAKGDPVLAAFGEALAQASRLRSIVYLSTVGVYGDHGGAWVDEETAPRAGIGTRARTAGRGTRLARSSAGAQAPPSPSCGSPASMDPGATRSCRSRAAMRGASSSPARSSTAFMSPTSPRRSMRRWRARPPAFSTSPTTSRARPAIRSCSRRSF